MIKTILLICQFLLFCLYSQISLGAANRFYLNKLNHCKITQSALNDYEPEKFQPTNNLLRSVGGKAIFCGEKIIITGRVLDQNCVPVSDAKVYLWQVGCDGKYPYIPLRNRIDKKMLNTKNGSSFTGSGIATTNNQGEFYFITIYPPASKHEGGSYVNIRVDHRDLGTLQTKLILSKNKIINEYSEVSDVLIPFSDESTIYAFDIVMRGETSRRY